MQIQNNKLREEMESSKYELTNKVCDIQVPQSISVPIQVCGVGVESAPSIEAQGLNKNQLCGNTYTSFQNETEKETK